MQEFKPDIDDLSTEQMMLIEAIKLEPMDSEYISEIFRAFNRGDLHGLGHAMSVVIERHKNRPPIV